tara:strand:+ start:2231 stop:3148 length:918 start_codon:yes stop_codon:yes gene_type:complete
MRLFVCLFLLLGCKQKELPVWETEEEIEVTQSSDIGDIGFEPDLNDDQSDLGPEECFVEFPDEALHNTICKYKGENTRCILTCQYVENEEILELWGSPSIQSISGLERFRNLKELYLIGSQVQDLGPISDLSKLEFLDLGLNHEISNLRPIRELRKLRRLELYNVFLLNDLSPLQGLENLEHLNLKNVVRVSDLRPLNPLRKMRWLKITGSQVVDVSPLSNLNKLETLYIYDNDIESITPLRELSKIEALWLDGNPIKNLLPLLDLENLRELGISGIPATEINCEVIDQLRESEDVYMNHPDLCE